jgi:phthiodiolone/phenolphthiodiolone dimycocerosates ketoreductase
MAFQLSAFMRTTLPLDITEATALDDGRYHSIWFPDHLVSFWPDAIWTPEFTDLATVSKSPHRYLETMSVVGAAAALTKRASLVTAVTDTARRHPVLLAQSALTLSHLSKGRFILGIGSGEHENTVPYGIPFDKPVSRFEEALEVIRMLWETDGTVDFEGRFFRLEEARLDTEPYDGEFPPIWIGGNGPRMLEITGRQADGWISVRNRTPEEFQRMHDIVRTSAEKAGRDPDQIMPAALIGCVLGEPDEIDEILRQPLLQAYIFQTSASDLERHGVAHPCGSKWRGYVDINPATMTRERMLDVFEMATPELLRKLIICGTPREVALQFKGYVDAGVQLGRMLDYSGMGGLKFAATSPAKVREAEDELMRLVG